MKSKDNLSKAEKIEEPDERDQSQGGEEPGEHKLVSYTREHKTLVMAVAIVVVAVVALLFFFKSQSDSDSLEASLALSRVMPFYNQANYEVALKGNPKVKVRGEPVIGLESIVSKYEGTTEGKTAALLAGNSYLSLNKPGQAMKYFDIATSSDSKIVEVGGYAGMGQCYESENKLRDAAEDYQKASDLSIETTAKDRYAYFAGLCFEKSGDKEKAVEIYRNIIAANQLSEFAGKAKQGLVRLGMIIE